VGTSPTAMLGGAKPHHEGSDAWWARHRQQCRMAIAIDSNVGTR
jgi:hypothetical protein